MKNLVAEKRLMFGFSQRTLAEKAQIPRQTIERIEGGVDPKTSTAVKIAIALSVSVEELFPPSEPDAVPGGAFVPDFD